MPQMLSNGYDVDQQYLLMVDGEFITRKGILPMPSDRTSYMAGINAHIRLSNIILKVVKYIYPIRNAQCHSNQGQRHVFSYSKIQELERELWAWMKNLPTALRYG